jgi:carbon monoxide dehydrogenase subunit G
MSRTINAPVDAVFETVSDISNYTKAVPELVRVEFVTEQRVGVGTRFRETRRMGKREATTELEVTEYERNERVRMVSDAGGTIWDSVFTVTPEEDGSGTRLDVVMEARPYRLMSRLFVPLMKGAVAKAVAGDMDALKAWLEGAG